MQWPSRQVKDPLCQRNWEVASKNLTPGPFITPTLLNSWAQLAGGTPIGYYKDGLGRAFIHGRISGGASGTVAFNLPAIYRPATDEYFPVLFGGPSSGYGIVGANGDVVLTYPGTSDAFLQMSYRVG